MRPVSFALVGLLGLLALLALVIALPSPAWAADGGATRRIEIRPGQGGRLEITNEGTSFSRRSEPRSVQSRASLAARTIPPRELTELIHSAALRNDLDPDLVAALIQAESAWNVRAVSHKGALGLMQIMPATARDLALEQPFDAAENIRAGTEYLRRMLDLFDGDVVLALAAYNAGPTTVASYGGVPPYQETVTYVRRVLGFWRGDDAPAVVPVTGRPRPAASRSPARSVRWNTSGARLHLTNVQ